MAQQSKKADFVFEGGGVRGIALVGALSVFEAAGYEGVNVAGTSAGAIVAALYAAGYTTSEIKDEISTLGFDTFTDPPPIEGRLPLLGSAIDEIFLKGLYKGDKLEGIISHLLAKKNIHTFGDLLRNDTSDERYRFKVRMIASDITRRRALELPQDFALYGIKPEDFDVAQAVRMSISIPFFFMPVKLNGSTIVDGGLLSNFPIELFDVPGDVPEWPTFGIKLTTHKMPGTLPPQIPPYLQHFASMSEALAILNTAIEAPSIHFLENDKQVRTVTVDTGSIMSTDFKLTPEQKDWLYDSGVQAAKKFLQGWDFENYKADFFPNQPKT